MDQLLTPAEVQERLRMARSTLTYWRATNQGPPWIRLGKASIRYPAAGLDAWIAAQGGGGEPDTKPAA